MTMKKVEGYKWTIIIVNGMFLTHRIFDKQRYIGILKSVQV